MKKGLFVLICLGASVWAQAPPSAAATKEANLKEYVHLLRQDVQKQKVAILTDLMELSAEDSAKFWPVYNEYDKALTKLKDERLALIKDYAQNYGSLTDEKAMQIANAALDLDGKRNDLKREYLQKVRQALNAKLAARFLQIETQLEKIIDLQIASNLPIVE